VKNLVYRFGRCELDVDARELRVDGCVRALDPRPFALLTYLLRQRHRVIRKDELIDEVWPDRIVTVGALARAVCCVRKAIDDDSSGLLQTLHRVGYRFIGEVSELRPSVDVGAGATPPVVALLPTEERTGEAALAWSAIGLVATVGHVLAARGVAWPLPVPTLMATLATLQPALAPAEIAQVLRARHDVTALVQTRIARETAGYRLDCSLFTTGAHAQFTLRAEDPMRLGRKMTRQLSRHLLPESVSPASASPGEQQDDPWVLELFAHAMHASAQGHTALAQKFLRVVLEYEPHFAEAASELASLPG
jgi:DNA-binding winged helix-turn-helix (wHTH) protein